MVTEIQEEAIQITVRAGTVTLSTLLRLMAALARQYKQVTHGSPVYLRCFLGRVPQTVGVQGGVVRQADGHDRSLLPVLSAMLRLWCSMARHKGFVC